MAHRIITDPAGASWQVWAVQPTREGRTHAPSVAPQYADGWLAFERLGEAPERRRYAPVPPAWADAPEPDVLALLAVVLVASIALIPLGLPGIWVMLAAAFGYDALVEGDPIGIGTIAVLTALALVAEVLEFTIAARYTSRYGGSRRAGWGAILGGVAGAIVGVPVPIVGSVIGAFVGSFAGAFLAERSRTTDTAAATRVATGALLGRAVAAALKTAFGVTIAAWLLLAAWR